MVSQALDVVCVVLKVVPLVWHSRWYGPVQAVVAVQAPCVHYPQVALCRGGWRTQSLFRFLVWEIRMWIWWHRRRALHRASRLNERRQRRPSLQESSCFRIDFVVVVTDGAAFVSRKFVVVGVGMCSCCL